MPVRPLDLGREMILLGVQGTAVWQKKCLFTAVTHQMLRVLVASIRLAFESGKGMVGDAATDCRAL